ncbi:hypothetical protein PS2_028583 [Malus domestica]
MLCKVAVGRIDTCCMCKRQIGTILIAKEGHELMIFLGCERWLIAGDGYFGCVNLSSCQWERFNIVGGWRCTPISGLHILSVPFVSFREANKKKITFNWMSSVTVAAFESLS